MDTGDADKHALAEELNQVHAELRDEAMTFPADLQAARPAPGASSLSVVHRQGAGRRP